MSEREIGIEEARKTLGDLIDAARLTGASTVITRHGKPAARIVPITEESTMSDTTTSYGTWATLTGELDVHQGIAEALGDYVDDYDLDAIVTEYVAAVDAILPEGVGLYANEFIGPAYDQPEFNAEEILDAINEIDLMAIAEKHDKTA